MRTAASALALVCLAGCADRGHTKATFDEQTGRLKELAADLNKNGTIDSWTEMDGALPVRARADLNEDGKIDRWEWYDADAKLVKIGFSRRDNGRPDAWAYPDPGGEIRRVDVSSAGDEKAIDRREYYERGVLARTEQDANRDGTLDQWETYAGGAVATAAFDDNGDGRPDRRWTYEGARLVLVESEPDASGRFTRRTKPGR